MIIHTFITISVVISMESMRLLVLILITNDCYFRIGYDQLLIGYYGLRLTPTYCCSYEWHTETFPFSVLLDFSARFLLVYKHV